MDETITVTAADLIAGDILPIGTVLAVQFWYSRSTHAYVTVVTETGKQDFKATQKFQVKR